MLMGQPWCCQSPTPKAQGRNPRPASLSNFCTFVASRSVTCFMVRGLYPLCRS